MAVFLERLKNGRVLVSDGATGTNLQRRGLPAGAAAEVWVLERPEELLQLHRDFISAGSDIILTCTFGGTLLRLGQSGLAERAVEVNRTAVGLAKQAADGSGALIAGSIGPLGHLLKPLGPLDESEAAENYRQQAQTLVEAGVDLLVVETQFDMTEASIAVRAVRSVTDLPLVCSFSFDRGTRTMMGVRPRQLATELPALGVDVLGINCGRSLDENLKSLIELKAALNEAGHNLPIWFKPNAGLPEMDAEGRPTYNLSPEGMGAGVVEWVENGALVVGGCCGTSPEHLNAIRTHRDVLAAASTNG